jgi:hypothetical protein
VSLHNTYAGHFIYVFDLRKNDFVRSRGTPYRDEDDHQMKTRDDVLVADTGHCLWPEQVRHGVSASNSSVPGDTMLTFESVELLRTECFNERFHPDFDYDSLYLTLYVGDMPQARFSIAHLCFAKAPLPVRRGPREVSAPPRQHYYWELCRHVKGRGHAVFHVAVAYSTCAYEKRAQPR